VLVWDMLDAVPTGYDLYRTVHYAIWAYGVALLDNALLAPLAEACAEEGRYEFMLTIAPLRVVCGTGSPLNPISLCCRNPCKFELLQQCAERRQSLPGGLRMEVRGPHFR